VRKRVRKGMRSERGEGELIVLFEVAGVVTPLAAERIPAGSDEVVSGKAPLAAGFQVAKGGRVRKRRGEVGLEGVEATLE
jgi:hypothetical protein